jgi:hypothetical protein
LLALDNERPEAGSGAMPRIEVEHVDPSRTIRANHEPPRVPAAVDRWHDRRKLARLGYKIEVRQIE